MKDKLFHCEDKLNYIIDYLGLKPGDISKKLEISPSMLSQIQKDYTSKLKRYHLYAISNAYTIPMEIFDNELINTPTQINALLDINQEESVFYKNEKLLEQLLGRWYLYSYPSNSNHIGVFETEHTIYVDGTVIDEHENKGRIHLGKHQSMIIKESFNSENLTAITFDNNRIPYNYFIFSRTSKSISLNKELFNFGFFSRNKLPENQVKSILGKRGDVQLQINYEMLERLSLEIKI